MKSDKSLIGTTILASVAASLCCITPVLILVAGTGSLASSFSWIEPFRPYLIGLTLLALALAWYRQLRVKSAKELECACEEDGKTNYWQSKRFLGIVTLFAILMLTFPLYSSLFYPQNTSNTTFAMHDNVKELHLSVEGMSCSSCEQHIEHALGKLEAVSSVKASYESGTAIVQFSPLLATDNTIIEAINATGYRVAKAKISNMDISEKIGITSIYKVPLVCHAAPSIGCGSRSKPILKDLENATGIKEAWLNRSGTLIAIVWNDGLEPVLKHSVISNVFEKHQLKVVELSNKEYADSYQSFSNGTGWFKGSEVDQLSKEEATIFADNLVVGIKEKTSLSAENERKLHQMATEAFYDFFLNYQSTEQLGDPQVYKAILMDIRAYGEKLLGDGKMPGIEELWVSCSNIAKSCEHEGCTSSCTVPNA